MPTSWLDQNGDLCVTPNDWLGPNACNDYNCNGIPGDPGDSAFFASHLGHCCTGPCAGGGAFCDSVIADPCLNICPDGDVLYTVALRDSCGNPLCDSAATIIDFGQCPDVIPCPGFHPDWPQVHPDSCDPATGKAYFAIHAGGYCTVCNPILLVPDVNGVPLLCRTLSAKLYDSDGNLCVDQTDFVVGSPCADYNCDGVTDATDQTIWAPHIGHCCANLPCTGNGPFCDSIIADPCLNICPDGDALYTITVRDSCGNPVCDTSGIYIDFSNCPDAVTCPNYHPDWPFVHPDSCDPATGMHYFSIHAGGSCTSCNPALVITLPSGVTIGCKTLDARFYDTNGNLCVDQSDFLTGALCNDYNCDGIVNIVDQSIWAPHFGHCCAATIDTCEFYKLPYKDYAPQGMPDFDEKQNPLWVDAANHWTHDGPTAVANCLWWFDSKYEPNPVDPRPFGITPPNDGYNLVTAYGAWDDHDPFNVAPLITELARWMSTNQPGVGPGTPIDSVVSGTRQYLASRGRLGDYRDTLGPMAVVPVPLKRSDPKLRRDHGNRFLRSVRRRHVLSNRKPLRDCGRRLHHQDHHLHLGSVSRSTRGRTARRQRSRSDQSQRRRQYQRAAQPDSTRPAADVAFADPVSAQRPAGRGGDFVSDCRGDLELPWNQRRRSGLSSESAYQRDRKRVRDLPVL